jgi:hypothetical protein
VEDQEFHQLRRLLGLSSIDLEPTLPPPLLRRKLDQQGSFETIGLQETMPNPSSREEHLILEEPTISYLGEEAPGPYKPLNIDLSTPVVIQVYSYECLIVSQATMEPNTVTSSRNSHIPSMTVTIVGVPPPNQPSLVQNTMVLTTST